MKLINNYEFFYDYDGHISDLITLFVGYEYCKKNHAFGPSIRGSHLLHFVKSGKGSLEIDGKHYDIGENQLFYIPPNTLHYYRADAQDPWYYKWISIEGGNAFYYMSLAGLSAKHPVMTCKNADLVDRVLDQLIENNEFGEMLSPLGVSSLTYRFLDLLTKNNDKLKKLTFPEKEAYVQRAMRYIQMSIHKRITVEDVAKHVGIDRSYLCALLKEQLGISPQNYIIRQKLSLAKDYLEHTTYDVKMIAGFVGYDDQFLFSRIFKKREGVSPREYRTLKHREWREERNAELQALETE